MYSNSNWAVYLCQGFRPLARTRDPESDNSPTILPNCQRYAYGWIAGNIVRPVESFRISTHLAQPGTVSDHPITCIYGVSLRSKCCLNQDPGINLAEIDLL